MAEITIPRQWMDQGLGLGDQTGTVMIIGAPDTGKSTLARYLYQQLCRQGCCAAYLDADMGQSTLGLPTTLNLAMPTGDHHFPPQGAHYSFFTGSITPRGHMLPALTGAHRLQQKALSAGARTIVVDTTGLVDQEQGGKALKQWKIELLAPGTVIALRRAGELEPILWPLRRDDRVRCVELDVSPHVVRRDRKTRIERRHALLARYLEGTQPRTISLRQTAVYDLENLAAGALMAFQDREGFALGLGVVTGFDRQAGTLIVRTPLPSLEGVASIRLGTFRWDLAQPTHL